MQITNATVIILIIVFINPNSNVFRYLSNATIIIIYLISYAATVELIGSNIAI